MKQNYIKSLLVLLLTLLTGSVTAETLNGTIAFGSAAGSLNINKSSVSGKDNQEVTWLVTTEGTSSFTANSGYAQIGSSKSPATSITLVATLPETLSVGNISAKLGGFSGTAGTVTIQVGETTLGTGRLNESKDVEVTSEGTAKGNTITIGITGIARGVKVYSISYQILDEGVILKKDPQLAFEQNTYTFFTDQSDMQVTALCGTNSTGTITYSCDNEALQIDAKSGAITCQTIGTYQVTASIAETDEFNAAKAICNVNIKLRPQDYEQGAVAFIATTMEAAYAMLNEVSTGKYMVSTEIYPVGNKFLTPLTIDSLTWKYTRSDGKYTAQAANGYYLTSGGKTNISLSKDAVESSYWTNSTEEVFTNATGQVLCYNSGAPRFNTYDKSTASMPAAKMTPITNLTNTVDITIGTDGYATYCMPLTTSIPENVTAYTGAVSGEYLVLTKITTGQIPAQTGVVLMADPGTYTFTAAKEKAEPFTGNELVGVTKETELPNTNGKAYLLANKDNEVAFYLASDGAKLAANKAYLWVRGESQVKAFHITDLETGISTVRSTAPSAIYNLAGQRLQQLKRGINIINGKKIIW